MTPDPRDPGKSAGYGEFADEFPKRRSCCYTRDLRACELVWPWKNLGRGILAAEKKRGGPFWPRQNLGRAILAAEKLGRALFWLRKNNVHAHILDILYTHSVFLIYWKPSEEQFCEARMP